MQCWKCQKLVEWEKDRPIPFRLTCDHCHFYLHSCKNCEYYQPGKPNDCQIPGTDPIADREGVNFCEEFRFKKDSSQKKSSLPNKLFGEDVDLPKRDFNSLFDD